MHKDFALPSPRLIVILGGILGIILFLELMIGQYPISISEIAAFLTGDSDPTSYRILTEFRIPKALTGVLCGAGLATGGLLTQSLFRNPLTGPDILGLTSGAGLAVALAILTGLPLGATGITGMAIIGSAGTFLLLMLISRKVGNHGLLVAGIMLSAFTSSVIAALQAWSGSADLQRFTVWGFGTISQTGLSDTGMMAIPVVLGIGIGLLSSRGLNAMGLSDDYAASVGVNVRRVRRMVLIATALLTGGITAYCGPISFIGIAAPHLVKRLTRLNDHRMLIPLSACAGAILVLGCDLLAQVPGNGAILPLNAVTALAGAPVVLWAILKFRQNG